MEFDHEKPLTFFRFEDLRVYHKALEYVTWVYTMTDNLNDDPFKRSFYERFLTSAQNIALNIAEGSSRNKSQFIYYLKMAKSAVRECVVLSTIAKNRSILANNAFDDSKNHLMEMTKMIGALIGSLQRSIKPGEIIDDDEEEII